MEPMILQCVDEVLEMLGRKGKQAFIAYLEENLGLEKEEIPQKPELFSKGLFLIFGEQGSNMLETAIAEKLLSTLGVDAKSKLTLVGAIIIVKATQRNLVDSHTLIRYRHKKGKHSLNLDQTRGSSTKRTQSIFFKTAG
jgi:hypothetical protein